MLGLLLLLACKEKQAPPSYREIARERFNALAAELAQPVFWAADEDGDATLDPEELSTHWGLAGNDRNRFVGPQGFTPAFADVFRAIVARHQKGPGLAALPEAERLRREAVLDELSQGRPTLIASDFSSASPEEKGLVRHIAGAAEKIEVLYARQRGTHGFLAELAKLDPESRALFFRNQGPACVAPRTLHNAACFGLPNLEPEKRQLKSGLYPDKAQDEPELCPRMQREIGNLLSPFTVVVKRGNGFAAVPYNEVYRDDMKAVALELDAAAKALGETDPPLHAYLDAAARAFESNDWASADEAWAAMSASSSKWYLRVGPDETYSEPCNQKAAFHLSFARIDPGSRAWRERLEPIKQDMEKALAELCGPPYKAREVAFHLPDFIDVVLNAGDSRPPHGAIIGQSLPNFGPVADESRGRTMVMTGFYTDADSRAANDRAVDALFSAESAALARHSREAQLLGTILHEAAHNLGPTHHHRTAGKVDTEIFGGPLASTLEELKSQTAALFFTDWLTERGLLDPEQRKRTHAASIVWAMGQVARGMTDEAGRPKPYGQLAAIQLGFLLEEKALVFEPEAKANNGEDTGAFRLDFERFPKAAAKLMALVAKIKSTGAEPHARALVKAHVDSPAAKTTHALIAERLLRAPRATFIYELRW